MVQTYSVGLVLILLTGGAAGQLKEHASEPQIHNIAVGENTFILPMGGRSTSGSVIDGDESTCITLSSKETWAINLERNETVTGLNINTGSATPGWVRVYAGINYTSMVDCKYFNNESSVSASFNCFQPINARLVYIENSWGVGHNIQLCEVQIYTCKDGYFGPDCQLPCNCAGDVPCDKHEGFCPSGCAPGVLDGNCRTPCPDGQFGRNCEDECRCAEKAACAKDTGHCPGACAPGWIGDICQSQLPNLDKTEPKAEAMRTTATSITLKWDSWLGPLQAEHGLVYQVQYQAYGGASGSVVWTQWTNVTSLVTHRRDKPYQDCTVSPLTLNTFYKFRIIPRVVMGTPETFVEGRYSLVSTIIRTACLAPEAPTMDRMVSWVDTSYEPPRSVISVYWVAPTLINCDNIGHYDIYYRTIDATDWMAIKSAAGTTVQNVSDVLGATTYIVRLRVVNNANIPSLAVEASVTTAGLPPASGDHRKSTVDSAHITVFVAIGVGAILLTILLVIGLLLCKRCKKKPMHKGYVERSHEELVMLMNGSTNGTVNRAVGPRDVLTPEMKVTALTQEDSGMVEETYSTDRSINVTTLPLSESLSQTPDRSSTRSRSVTPNDQRKSTVSLAGRPIRVAELEAFVNASKANEYESLRCEYRELPEGLVHSCEHGRRQENRHKNKFINIIPYDHSRVVLDKMEEVDDSDYINANYINGYQKPKAYIAAQGCNKYTIQDVWRLVWQVNCRRIIMVTNLVEDGKRKCERYWPDTDNVEKAYENTNLSVTLLDTEKTVDYVIRTFSMRKGEEVRNVKQFHFTAWPDHGVPTQAGPLMAFRRKVRAHDVSHAGVMVIHCSAGVGRTGTFIALDSLLEQAAVEDTVDIFGTVLNMRKDRASMIQTDEQYVFVYTALLETLNTGETVIPCSEFHSAYARLKEINDVTGLSHLQEQFQMLQTLSPAPSGKDCKSAILPENKEKNRCSQVLPSDRSRPYLMTRVPGTNDYINAAFIDGYKSKSEYIITQMPLPHTVIDLWRLVYEHDVGTLVMLNLWDAADESYGQYWPEAEACECGPFILEPVSIDSSNEKICVREVKLTYTADSPITKAGTEQRERVVCILQLLCWPRDAPVPSDSKAIVHLSQLVDKCQLKTGNGPLLVHCHDGVHQSGLYVAVSALWERMRVEQEVDVYHTVKNLRFQRPDVVTELEQYQFCYDLVAVQLEEFQLYANFS